MVKPSAYQYCQAKCVAALTHAAYQPCSLQGALLAYAMGYLILESASRLDAFSVYPIRTQLPSCTIGMITGAPEDVERLLEYKMYKYASFELKDRQVDAGKVFFKEPSIPDDGNNQNQIDGRLKRWN